MKLNLSLLATLMLSKGALGSGLEGFMPNNNHNKETALLLANEGEQMDTIQQEFLNACETGNLTAVQNLCEANGIDVNWTNDAGNTALYLAVKNGHVAVVKFLLSLPEIDPNKAEISKEKPLFAQSPKEVQDAYKAAYKRLEDVYKKRGVDVGVDKIIRNATPLSNAILNGNLQIVELLSKCPTIDVNKLMICGLTPLCFATQKGNLDMVNFLLKVPAIDVNQEILGKDTSLHIAACYDHLEIVRLLLEKNADTTLTNIGGKTALDLAQSDQMRDLLRGAQSILSKRIFSET
jgi:ankyrin repeat protein